MMRSLVVLCAFAVAPLLSCGSDGTSGTDASSTHDQLSTDVESDAPPDGVCTAEPFCDGNTAVVCQGGRDVSTDCGEQAYCNSGSCVESGFVLPGDAAPHENVIEWWYYTGHLSNDDHRFGFEISLFQQRMEDLLGFTVPDAEEFGFMCHVALLDKDLGEHFYTQGITTFPTEWTQDPLVLDVLNCRLELSGDGHDRIVGLIPAGEEGRGDPRSFSFDLQVDTTKPVAHHGTDGIIPMAFGGDSYYYSFTRMTAEGTVEIDGEPFEVAGQAWMDHQWGDFQTMDFKGWDWWSMQFEDGWEIMLFQFRDWDDVLVEQAGTLVDPEGNIVPLEGLEDYSVTSLRSWSSSETDGTYPLDWNIRIEPLDWDLEIRTQVDEQELPNFAKNYWEGAVTIAGTRSGQPVTGVGYVELTGYASNIMDP